jgi:hypothetical protein
MNSLWVETTVPTQFITCESLDGLNISPSATIRPIVPCCPRSYAYTDLVKDLRHWHILDPLDRTTYPTVDGPMQVKYRNGTMRLGYRHDFFPSTGLVANSLILNWRYIMSRDTT